MNFLEIKKVLLSLGGVIAAVLSSACCVIPFMLFTFGVSGSWLSNLTFFAPYRLYFIFVTIVFLGIGFFMVYRKTEEHCSTDNYCKSPKSTKIAKIMLWIATILVVISLAFPYFM